MTDAVSQLQNYVRTLSELMAETLEYIQRGSVPVSTHSQDDKKSEDKAEVPEAVVLQAKERAKKIFHLLQQGAVWCGRSVMGPPGWTWDVRLVEADDGPLRVLPQLIFWLRASRSRWSPRMTSSR